MDNFKRSSMVNFYNALSSFINLRGIHMGIDTSDDRPNIVGYVFYHELSGRGCMIMIDFNQVKDLCETISVCMDALRDQFNLEE